MYKKPLMSFERAQCDVKCNPRNGQPACPVLSAQHENPADGRTQLCDLDQENILVINTLREEFSPVINKADASDGDV